MTNNFLEDLGVAHLQGNDLYLKAIKMACTYHALQRYGDLPYYKHLEQVEKVLLEKGYIGQSYVITAWLHDILEDTSLSYNDIKKEFGERIADAVFLMTEYRGKNRKERKPNGYYVELGKNCLAGIVKIADRIANIENSTDSGLFEMYRKEQEKFSLIYKQNPEGFKDIWGRLVKALEVK